MAGDGQPSLRRSYGGQPSREGWLANRSCELSTRAGAPAATRIVATQDVDARRERDAAARRGRVRRGAKRLAGPPFAAHSFLTAHCKHIGLPIFLNSERRESKCGILANTDSNSDSSR